MQFENAMEWGLRADDPEESFLEFSLLAPLPDDPDEKIDFVFDLPIIEDDLPPQTTTKPRTKKVNARRQSIRARGMSALRVPKKASRVKGN